MGKRGPKPRGEVSTRWSAQLAYAVGLLVTDGNLAKVPGHITFTSKDRQQITNYMRCLGINKKIGKTKSGYNGNISLRVQLKDILFYNFLVSIGVTPAKSKTLKSIAIPDLFFFDFLRGVFDGDGSSYSYWDKRWKSSFMFYVGFASASPIFIFWLQRKGYSFLGITGHISADGRKITQQLKYAKRESLILLKRMYDSRSVVCLMRKRLKLEKTLAIVGEQL